MRVENSFELNRGKPWQNFFLILRARENLNRPSQSLLHIPHWFNTLRVFMLFSLSQNFGFLDRIFFMKTSSDDEKKFFIN